MGSGGNNKQYEQEQAKERQRQKDLEIERGVINDQFGDQYNDDYYNNYKKDYLDYYTPQLQDQFTKASENLTKSLYSRGMYNSSAGQKQLAELESLHNDRSSNIVDQATSNTNTHKQNILNTKSNILSDVELASNPSGMSSNYKAQISSLASPQVYDPLMNTFTDFLNSYVTTTAISNMNTPQQNKTTPSSFKGSAKNIT
ncbi:MAG: hypothetical protein GY793_08420 [Proteobacteria bacterium]|nr:hypothetical protein [Pseudomonadota bacterium]